MLSIARTTPGSEQYYLELGREDYYLAGGEPEGVWFGRGAEALGLTGAIDKNAFANLFRGLDPTGEKALGQAQHYADGRERQPGWDLTFSAPKSVSALWSQLDGEARKAVQEAQLAAVRAALGYLQEKALVTRRGAGGRAREPVTMVAGLFEHGTSRAQDPQLHTHCLVMNLGVRADGSVGSVVSHEFYRNKMLAGALYRAELAHQLAVRLGLVVSPLKNWFELKGVPKAVLDAFSKRSAEINAAVAEGRTLTAKDRDLLVLSTRQVKEHIARDELFPAWQDAGRDLGFGPATAQKLLGHAKPLNEKHAAARARDLSRGQVAALTASDTTFTERDLLLRTALAAQAEGISVHSLREAVAATVRPSGLGRQTSLVSYPHVGDERRFTTQKVLDLEKRFFELASTLAARSSHPFSDGAIDRAIASRPRLSAEQQQALRHLADRDGDVRLLSGLAGTGKTSVLDALRAAAQESGYTVVGTALAGIAARGLQDASGIASDTIAKLLINLADGKQKLTSKHILVVDEAGMVGTSQMAELFEHAATAGAKVILVGDEHQLQPIDAGAPFRFLGEKLGVGKLLEIKRQYEEWMRDAVRQVLDGDIRGALTQYALAARLKLADSREKANHELIKDWCERRTTDLRGTLILCGTRDDAQALNRMAQDERRSRGELTGKLTSWNEGLVLQIGDRVAFTKNNRRLGIWNGDRGVVESIYDALGNPLLTVRLDRERATLLGTEPIHVAISPSSYKDLELGYAVTTHKAQGATVERAFVSLGGAMQDRALSYVQLSRARESTFLYASKSEVDEDIGCLVQQMERVRVKKLAHEVAAQSLSAAIERLAHEDPRLSQRLTP